MNYTKHHISESDISAVVDCLRSGNITRGDLTKQYEQAITLATDTEYAVAFNTGTTALQAGVAVMRTEYERHHQPDERSSAMPSSAYDILTTPLTFIATTNACLLNNCHPVFTPINDQGLMDINQLAHIINTYYYTPVGSSDPNQLINKQSGRILIGVLPVHYTGQLVCIPHLLELASHYQIYVLDDGAHSLGITRTPHKLHPYHIGTAYSTHPAKIITTGEGGIVTTNNHLIATKLKQYRNNGLSVEQGVYTWHNTGINGHLSDIQAALGLSQIRRLDWNLARRRYIASEYIRAGLDILGKANINNSAWHITVLRVNDWHANHAANRIQPVKHYTLVNKLMARQPHKFTKYPLGGSPNDNFDNTIVTLPCYPDMTNEEVQQVIDQQP